MQTVVVGAGPTGLFSAVALARRGHSVVVVDRDPGPVGVRWNRKGVMQFHHAHTFRGPVVEALRAEMPDVLDDLVAAGAAVASVPGSTRSAALLCRRALFERTLRRSAAAQPGVTLVTGHVEGVLAQGRRAGGVRIGDTTLTADMVIDASGRAGRFTTAIRPAAASSPCGAVYIGRQYRLHPGAGEGPVNSVIGLSLSMRGYAALAFLHDNRTFSVVLVHDGTDPTLRELRHAAVFESVVREIPALAEWIDTDRSHAITSVLPGGRVFNSYRGQLDDGGRLPLPGLISVGDAVCTTTPLAGRGVSLALTQAQVLVRLIDEHDRDLHSVTTAFDGWCAENVKPWFDDHEHADTDRLRRWAGEDIDLTRPLPSDLIVAAADADNGLLPLVAPYITMDALPASLATAQPWAKAIYASGWRPAVPPGPDRATLAEMCARLSTDRQLCLAG